MYKLPMEKSQSQHMRTSKTGKVYVAGEGSKKENNFKKGDKVKSPYAGRELKDGTKAKDYGIITNRSKGYIYIDYGVGKPTAIPEKYADEDIQIYRE